MAMCLGKMTWLCAAARVSSREAILRACIKRQSAGGAERGVLHRYSNSSSKYFSEYSISWAVMMLRARVELVRS